MFIIKDHQARNTRALLLGGGELEEQDSRTAQFQSSSRPGAFMAHWNCK